MTKLLRILIAAALLSMSTVHLACHAAGGTVTIGEYERALGVVQNKLDSAAAAVKNGDDIADVMPGDLAKRELGSIDAVRMDDGSLLRVSTTGLTASIVKADNAASADKQENGYEQMSRRIESLREEAASAGNLPAVAPSTAPTGRPLPAEASQALARKILNGQEFGSDPVAPPSWLDLKMVAMSKAISKWLDKLFRNRGPNVNMPNISPKLLWGVFWVVIAALFVLLVWIIAQVIGRRQARAKPLSLSDAEEALVEARDKDTLISLAEKHARAGDHRAAFRLVYLATLIALDTNGILRFDRSRTNWEYVRQLRDTGRRDVYDVLMPLTREFDRVWYGLSPAGPEVYRRAVIEYEKLNAPEDKAAAA